jgi:hypothetical protein
MSVMDVTPTILLNDCQPFLQPWNRKVAAMSNSTVNREFFQRVLASAFTVQQSQMDAQSLSAMLEVELSTMRRERVDGAKLLVADGTINVVNASGAVSPLAVGPPGGVQNPLPGLEEDDQSSGASLVHLASALSGGGDGPRTAVNNEDAYFKAFRMGPPEVRNAPFPLPHLWTPSLLILVIALAMLLGWMLGRVTLRRTADMKGPPPLVRATPDAVPSQPKETGRADSKPPLPVAQKAGTPETASGGLVVYQAGRVVFRLKPSENVTLSTLKPGKTMLSRQTIASKSINLKPRASTSVMVSLVITNGTPESTVEVDGKTIGRLEANGSLELPNALTEGQHSIVLAKANFESREFPVTAKPPEFRLPDVKLTSWPKLTFQTTTPNVTVKYQRSGDSQVHQVPASEKLILRPGQYDFTAEVPGFQNNTTKVNLVPGYEGSIPLKFDPVPGYQFQDATQVVHDGPEWFKSKDAHAFVQLKPGLLHETLIFTKPAKTAFWNKKIFGKPPKVALGSKKIEWKIEASDRSAGVDYILDGQKMVRKLVIGESPSDIKEAKVDVTAATQATLLSVQIDVDGSHVQIRNDKGLMLDSYTAPQHNFSGGRIGIKTESLFVVRDK